MSGLRWFHILPPRYRRWEHAMTAAELPPLTDAELDQLGRLDAYEGPSVTPAMADRMRRVVAEVRALRAERHSLLAVTAWHINVAVAMMAERDALRTERDSIAEVARLLRVERDSLAAAMKVAAERMTAAEREADRWRHGVPVEGDYVCPDSQTVNYLRGVLITISEADGTTSMRDEQDDLSYCNDLARVALRVTADDVATRPAPVARPAPDLACVCSPGFLVGVWPIHADSCPVRPHASDAQPEPGARDVPP